MAPTGQVVQWGTRKFRASRVLAPYLNQQINRLGVGLAIDRICKEGDQPFLLQDFSSGLDVRPAIFPTEIGINRFRFSQGLQTRAPGLLILPDKPSVQESITNDEDISGGVAANWRVIEMESAVGSSSGLLPYYAFGHILYRVDSNGDYEVADTFTDVITAGGDIELPDGTQVFAIACKGATDSIKATTDPTAGSITWDYDPLIALSAGDYITGMRFLRTLGPNGTTIIRGKVGGVNKFWYLATAESEVVKPVVLSLTSESWTSNPTAHSITNPTTAAGDLLLYWFTNDGNATVTTPSGLTSLDSTAQSTNVRHSVYYRIADGTESAQEVDFVTSSGEDGVAHIARIQAGTWHGTTAPEVGTAEAGSSGSPPPVTPSWGSEATLWFVSLGGSSASFDTIVLAAPVGYRDFETDSSADASTGAQQAIASRWLKTVTEDPSNFQAQNFTEVVAQTVAVRPASTSAGVTLLPVPDATTLDDEDTDADLHYAFLEPVWAGADVSNKVSSGASGTDFTWLDSENVLSDDSSFAYFGLATDDALGDHTGDLYVGFTRPSSVPKSAFIKGTRADIKRYEEASNDNVTGDSLRLYVNGSQRGLFRQPNQTEWGTTVATESIGDLDLDGQDASGVVLRGEDLEAITIGFRGGLTAVPAGSNNNAGRVTYAQIGVAWRPSGVSPSIPIGGFFVARNPAQPLRITEIAPVSDEPDTITLPREAWHADFAWDAEGSRPTVTISQPNEAMKSVWAADAGQGGYLLAGGDTNAPGDQITFINSQGQPLNYRMPKSYGSYTPKVNSVRVVRSWGLLDVILYDSNGTIQDCQQWWLALSESPTYYPDFLLQSLSGTSIAADPLPVATANAPSVQGYVYRVFDNSGETAVTKVFCPADPSADPRTLPPTTKHDSAVYLETVRLSLGPEEALKALGGIDYLQRQISAANGTIGTVKVEASFDGGSTFSTSAVQTFTSAFEEYDVPGPGVAYREVLLRITLAQGSTAAATATPQGLPIRLSTSQQWEPLKQFVFTIDDPTQASDGFLFSFLSEVETLIRSRLVQSLSFADQADVPARLVNVFWPQGGIILPIYGAPVKSEDFQDVRGNPASLTFVFEEVRAGAAA